MQAKNRATILDVMSAEVFQTLGVASLAAGLLLIARRRAQTDAKPAAKPKGGTPQNQVDVGSSPHADDLYEYDELATGIKGWAELFDSAGQVKQEHLDTFREDGLLVIEGAFSKEEIAGAFEAVSKICRQDNEGFERTVAEQPAVLDFTSGIKWALCQWEAGTDMSMDPKDRQDKVRKLMGFCRWIPLHDILYLISKTMQRIVLWVLWIVHKIKVPTFSTAQEGGASGAPKDSHYRWHRRPRATATSSRCSRRR